MALATPQQVTGLHRQGSITVPAPFVASRTGAGSIELMTRPPVIDLNGLFGADELLENFASILGPTRSGSRTLSVHSPQYLQSVDLYQPYKDKVFSFLSDIMDASILNSRANFLSTYCCPIWQTNDMNFSVIRKQGNNMLFTRISELGVPEEQTHFEEGWTSSVEKAGLRARISRDLALDSDFGMAAWIQELALFAANSMLTINTFIIYGLMNVGWTNIVEGHSIQVRQDLDRMLQEESANFLLAPLDADMSLASIGRMKEKIPTFNTVICPAGTMRYYREIKGESMTMKAYQPYDTSSLEDLQMRIYDGPDSAKTIMFGSDPVHFIELNPMVQNTRNPIKHQPLTRRVTIGQFHPPNPRAKPHDPVLSNDPTIHTIMMYYQTPTTGMLKPVTLHDRLVGCNAYDRSGQPAAAIDSYVEYLNHNQVLDDVPWPWNHRNPEQTKNAGDINKDTGDYGVPDMVEVSGKESLHDMHSFRSHPCFISYDPHGDRHDRHGEYYVPKKILGFMLSALPNIQIHQAAKCLALRLSRKTGRDDLDAAFYAVDQIMQTFRDAEWSDVWVEALINKNIARIMTRGTDGRFILEPHRTSDEKLRHYKGANAVAEFRGNADGVLDLPDKETSLLFVDVPAGYAFGAGLIYLAREARKPQSRWRDIGEKAEKVVRFFNEILQVARESIHPKLDSVNGQNSHEWVQKEDALAVLIDAYIEPEGPIFLGVPPDVVDFAVEKKAVVEGGGVNIPWDVDPGAKENPAFQPDGLVMGVRVGRGAVFGVVVVVTNRERAWACLTGSSERVDIGNKLMRGRYDPKLQAEVDSLLALIIATARYHTKPTEDRLKLAHVLALAGVDVLEKATTVTGEVTEIDVDSAISGLQALMARAQGSQKEAKLLFADLVRDFGSVPNNTKEELASTMGLLAYENNNPGVEGVVNATWQTEGADETTKERREKEERQQRAELKRATPEHYKGTYTKAPLKYLRAPLAATHELRRYLATKDKVSYVLPASADDNFEVPESLEQAKNKFLAPAGERDAIHHAPSFFSGLRPLMAQFSQRKRGGGRVGASGDYGDDDDDAFVPVDHNDLFTSLRQPAQTTKAFDIGRMLQFGDRYDDERRRARRVRESDLYEMEEDETDPAKRGLHNLMNALKLNHRGPIRERMRYAKEDIQSPSERFFFKLILEAPNERMTLTNLAAIQARLFDVVVVRPWITAETNLMVLMEAGPRTCLYAVGHSTVQVTKEQRGLFTMGCGFWHGFVPINPDAIAILLNMTPHAFIGGKKLDFMKDAKNWGISDPSAKESMIGFLIPTTEAPFSGYMNLRNNPAYASPDALHARWEAKCSAFGGWYDWLYQHYKPEAIDAQWATRKNVHAHVNIAHNLSLGPTIYFDPSTGKDFDVEGVGPSGSRRMNCLNAYLTWNGQTNRFPIPAEYTMSNM